MDIAFKKAVMNALLPHRQQNQTSCLPDTKKIEWLSKMLQRLYVHILFSYMFT